MWVERAPRGGESGFGKFKEFEPSAYSIVKVWFTIAQNIW
jgi:hypothetical protein